MKRIVRTQLLLLLLLPLWNCGSVTAQKSTASDLLERALVAAEKGGDPLVIALEETATPEVRKIAASLRQTVALKDAGSAEYLLPSRHVQVQKLEIDGASATIVLLLGPVPRPAEGPSLACGATWVLSFTLDENGEWVQGPTAVSSC